jgi:alpha-L-fucosidase 2
MLLQSHEHPSSFILSLLPALPKAWPDGRAHGLRARGGFTVDLDWHAGRLTAATLHSTLGGPCRLRTKGVAVKLQGSDAKLKRVGEAVAELDTRKGQVYRLVAAEG